MSEEEATELVIERAAEKLARMMRGIVPERVYSPQEAEELLGMDPSRKRAGQTIREIPRELLPDVPVTAKGGIRGYYGRDLIRYIEMRRRTA